MIVRTPQQRADRAMRALRAYKGDEWCQRVTPSIADEVSEAASDLLADLHHLTDTVQPDGAWDAQLARADMHYAAEIMGDFAPYADADARLGGNDA